MEDEEKIEGSSSVRETLESAVDTVVQDDTGTQSQENVVEIAAPDGWADEDKQRFTKIADPEIRKWLLGREENYTKKIGDYESRYKNFDDMFSTHTERLKRAGQTIPQVVQNYLNAQLAFEKDPLGTLKALAQHYKIDLKNLAGGEQQQQDNANWMDELDPNMKSFLTNLQKTVEGVNQFAQSETQQREQQMQSTINTSMTEFREAKDEKGQPLHAFMTDKRVTDRMALLISNGDVKMVPGDLKAGYKEAYDQAVYSFPDLRAKLTPIQQQASKERLLNAKKAGASVRGVGASQASQQTKGGVRDHLRAAASDAGLI